MDFGYVKIAAISSKIKVGNVTKNSREIISLIEKFDKDIHIAVFTELCLCGYTCKDMLFAQDLNYCVSYELINIAQKTQDSNAFIIIGAPLYNNNKLYDCAVCIKNGEILGVVPKMYLNEEENRWFSSGNVSIENEIQINKRTYPFGRLLFKMGSDICIGVVIGDDFYNDVPQSTVLSSRGANVIVNLSASCELVKKPQLVQKMIEVQSAKLLCTYVYANAHITESTTDELFNSRLYICERGKMLKMSPGFKRESDMILACSDVSALNHLRMNKQSQPEFGYEVIDVTYQPLDEYNIDYCYSQTPFVPLDKNELDERCEHILNMLSHALAKRVEHTNGKLVLGVSGGLDSTLALLVCQRTCDILGLDRKNIIAVSMDGFGSSERTKANALELIKIIGAELLEVDIKESCIQHFKDIGHDINITDTTFENAQARERTQILMDLANKYRGLVVGTGDLSELALGWCTFNGDHMSMYSVNGGIPKTLIRAVINYVSENDAGLKNVLNNILATPVSPELLPPDKNGNIAQKTEDIVGKYEIHDFFLYHFIRYKPSKEKLLFMAKKAFKDKRPTDVIKFCLKEFMRRFYQSQFKRNCSPDGIKVGSVSLSPKGSFMLPSDVDFE